jgi:Fic family protein
VRRGLIGSIEPGASLSGETVRAFVPRPLPPDPELQVDATLRDALDGALLALGRLDAVSELLRDPSLFLYMYVRKEAVLSSQIEGTQSSLSDLLLFEVKSAPGVPIDDVREVSNYVRAPGTHCSSLLLLTGSPSAWGRSRTSSTTSRHALRP